MTLSHVPVLLDETIDGLALRPWAVVVDGTFGGGGHTRAILEREPTARVVAVDRDPEAVARAEALGRELAGRVVAVHGSFAELGRLVSEVASEIGRSPGEGGQGRPPLRPSQLPSASERLRPSSSGLQPRATAGTGDHGGDPGAPLVDAVLLDLGLSSFQLDDPERGFAFRLEGPLDMRFDTGEGASAADLVNELGERELADLIYRNGEERRSRRVAAAIVRERAQGRIESTARLAEVVEAAVGGRKGAPTHPATQTFLALRIAVNDELGALRRGLAEAVGVLRAGGRLAVISFHSTEDRIVKQAMRAMAATCVCPPGHPVCTCGTEPLVRVVGKPVRPTEAEQRANPRSRSATLRVAERL